MVKKTTYICDNPTCAKEIPSWKGLYEIANESHIGIMNSYCNLQGIHVIDESLQFCSETCMLTYIHTRLDDVRKDIERDKMEMGK